MGLCNLGYPDVPQIIPKLVHRVGGTRSLLFMESS
jgi:hypothetical protein